MFHFSLPLSLLVAVTTSSAQVTFDVRGGAPFTTTLDGAQYPEYGNLSLRCDAGSCRLQKITYLCDRNDAEISHATVEAERIRVTQVPSATSPLMAMQIDDFGTNYRCNFRLAKFSASSDETLHVESYSCTYLSAWHGNKQKVERSIAQLDLKRHCKNIVLKRSAW